MKRPVSMLVLAAIVALLTAPAAAAGLEERRTFATDSLELGNLIGEIRIERHGGSGFEVTVAISGSDAREGLIRLDATDDELRVVFPDEDRYVYPPLGRSGKTTIKPEESGWLSNAMGRGRIEIRGTGQGLELWADVTVRMPSGGRLTVENGVGAITADGVEGELELSTRTGDLTARSTFGRLDIATGSGDVTLSSTGGERIEVATGSGDVTVDDSRSEKLNVATGSGDVALDKIEGRSTQVATGSGDVEGRRLDAEELAIATGSGDITVTLDQASNGEFSLASGSGDLELQLPSGASVDLHAETHSGEVRVRLDGDVRYRVREADEVKLTVGAGGATVDLATGSGDIRIGRL